LRRAVYNFMHGQGWRADVRGWFEFHVPRPRLARSFVRNSRALIQPPLILRRVRHVGLERFVPQNTP